MGLPGFAMPYSNARDVPGFPRPAASVACRRSSAGSEERLVTDKHRVIIVGGGFAGLNAARKLDDPRIDLTLVDRRNFHLFQPLLYQVATGGLSPAEVCAPLRAVVHRQRNTRVLLDEVTGVDPEGRRVLLADGRSLPYDTLIVATGATHDYFGHPEWEERAPGLKTIEDATTIRSRILLAFEEAEEAESEEERRRLLTFVIVGAGPTGVELAGAIGELARHTLRRDFRSYDPASARILLVDALPRVLPPYPESLSAAARRSLEKLGVTIHTGTMVKEIDGSSVTFERKVTRETGGGDGETERWTEEAGVILWTAGVRAASLADALAEATGAETEKTGKIRVAPDLSIPGHPEILVLGDMAYLEDDDGDPLPGIAPTAIQQGKYAAKLVKRRLSGRADSVKPFHYTDKGLLAVIGRAAAVADLRVVKLSGPLAWLLWLFIHIMYLVGFANRVLVLVQWAQSYIARGRGARLITDPREGPGAESSPDVEGNGSTPGRGW
jgi:NADH:ubiquinone reductase (H+-translocating)